ncbi:MAG: diacylglycerol O-acyltransferase [Candidatus Azotimanducaceae bacterium]|jgi:diacylglycerol O-acyltransferase
MQKLGMIDASFLYSETDKVFNHIASVQQFELPKNIESGEFIKGLKQYLVNRSHLVPYLTRVIKMMPGQIDHPVWISDDNFDIDNHVIEIPLEAPGTFDQLQNKVAQLHSQPMDRNIPLWSMKVITGLEDGTIYYYNQAHHACLDGMAGQAATMTLMDSSPDHKDFEVPANFPESEKPSLVDLFQSSLTNLMDFQARTLDRNAGILDSMFKMTQRALDPASTFGALGQVAPAVSFNKTIGQERTYACGKLALADVKLIGKSLDASVNDVFLSLCSGALRSYLETRGELPTRDLIAGCPVSTRKPNSKDMGNSVTMMAVDLASSIADPRTRLLKIKSSADTGKAVTLDLAGGFEDNIALLGLPAMAKFTSLATEAMGLANFSPLPINVVISNVPGPRESLYSNGAKMLSHFPVSIPVHGIGINITVQSYAGELFFGITACREALADAGQLRNFLLKAFKQFHALVKPRSVTEISIATKVVQSKDIAVGTELAPEKRVA